ncbi:fra a 1-associated protein-like isoform X2 [Ipomoea triloba]|uniref:fra a 1-associated protein-like isoform X2 n=1 Tax=Ipomoea triloba TaxID=35885 RepID=UPI00125E756F|nr:fra a 1-associated protein-like isoform X2 [Ipomoea triloba]
MGWVWQNDDDDVSRRSGDNPSMSSAGDAEPGKFVRKCEKTEEIFKDCVGRLPEMVQSNKEYTEEDVTNQMNKGFALPALESSHQTPFDFPGLRSDIEAMERNFFTGLDRFFGAAEDTMNGFFGSFGTPGVYNGDQSSSARTRGIPGPEAAKDTMNGFFGSFGTPRVYNGDQSSSARTRGIPVPEAAKDTMNRFFGSFGTPRVYNGDQSSSARTRGIPMERNPPKEPSTEVNTSDARFYLNGIAAGFDFSGRSKDV